MTGRSPLRRHGGTPLAVVTIALVLLAPSCNDDPADDLPGQVRTEVLDAIGIPTSVECEADPGGGAVRSGDGDHFRCVVTSEELDGTLVVEGTFVAGGSQRNQVVGGTGSLGEVAGFAGDGDGDGETP